ncbi:MAG TPA: diguanylate cyclase, partial [Baekduia sp.]|nr:diguanylate cyclase [Baekduia sp.]
VAIGSAGWAVDRVWAALAVGLGVNALADGLYGAATLQGHDWLFAWAEPLWPISMLITAAAAWQPRRYVIGGFEGMPALIVPGVASLVSLSLLVYGALPGTDVPLSVTIAATAALIVAGIRSMLTFRENLSLLTTSRTEALTDTLTGLGNRRALMLELDARLRRGRESEPSTLVFFDLDGFKGYNDAFGHSAGDALLVRLSQRLLNAMDQGATAFRPGGDEFCLVLNGILGRGDGAIERCASALSEVGDGFEVGVSFGIVVLPEEADDPVRAMNLVDERMYDDKGDRRMTARRQARDLLLQLLHEREPELEHHVGAVAAIAVSTGRHLGLGDEELDEIARGAELHDLGKVAIPDSILHKPGPLDENEWTLMYQHTVVGERILAAVPTLQPVARLVRASHERWDGGGYPDGIVGEAIPLGARIIALCDAFDAMVSARPYSDAMPVADAIKELRACAGAQFDPAVVAAFVEAFEAGALSHPAFETA